MRPAVSTHQRRSCRHCGVANRIGDAGMAQEVLQPAGIHALRRQGIAGRVPQHVNVNRERQPGGFTGMFDLARNAHDAPSGSGTRAQPPSGGLENQCHQIMAMLILVALF